jgi:hypothetical protein
LKSNPVLENNILYVFDSISTWIVEESDNIVYC